MKIGVLFPSRFEDPGEFLADARAMEAAGVDSVWFDEAVGGIDPLLALAAIAAVTTELRLGLIQTEAVDQRRIDTLQQLSRNRFISLPLAGRVGEGVTENWLHVTPPLDRDSWAATLAQAENKADGVIVPMDPRLLDILRHPDDAIDRSDLILAQG